MNRLNVFFVFFFTLFTCNVSTYSHILFKETFFENMQNLSQIQISFTFKDRDQGKRNKSMIAIKKHYK